MKNWTQRFFLFLFRSIRVIFTHFTHWRIYTFQWASERSETEMLRVSRKGLGQSKNSEYRRRRGSPRSALCGFIFQHGLVCSTWLCSRQLTVWESKTRTSNFADPVSNITNFLTRAKWLFFVVPFVGICMLSIWIQFLLPLVTSPAVTRIYTSSRMFHNLWKVMVL